MIRGSTSVSYFMHCVESIFSRSSMPDLTRSFSFHCFLTMQMFNLWVISINLNTNHFVSLKVCLFTPPENKNHHGSEIKKVIRKVSMYCSYSKKGNKKVQCLSPSYRSYPSTGAHRKHTHTPYSLMHTFKHLFLLVIHTGCNIPTFYISATPFCTRHMMHPQ